MLQHDPKLTVRGPIEQSNVASSAPPMTPSTTCTGTRRSRSILAHQVHWFLLPSDKAININKPGFAEYMAKLAAVGARKAGLHRLRD